MIDVAPTLLYSLGVPIPDDLEGQLPRNIFTNEFLRTRPVRAGPATVPPTGFPSVPEPLTMTDAEEAAVEGRLRALGYVD
jgi:hypothetical protein